MIINVRHTGVVVCDLNKMTKFYQALGFTCESEAIEEGTFIEQVVDIRGVKLEWVKLRSPDGYLLELLKYHSHQQPLKMQKSRSNDLGCSHMAFTVGNIEDACKVIVRAGGAVLNAPAVSPNGKVKVAYCYDPEGVIMEVVEEL